jgi:hypothetical protein
MAHDARKKLTVAEYQRLARRRALRVFACVAGGFVLLLAVLFLSDRTIGVAPDKLVTVYHTHGCPCVHQWETSLENGGFTVVMYEPETLASTRSKLRTPGALNGCHVGEYLGYFLEGHITPEVLSKIARMRPTGIGVVTEVTLKGQSALVPIPDEESGPVFLIGSHGDPSMFTSRGSSVAGTARR